MIVDCKLHDFICFIISSIFQQPIAKQTGWHTYSHNIFFVPFSQLFLRLLQPLGLYGSIRLIGIIYLLGDQVMKSSSRESYIDVIRGLAIIMVVLGHLGMPSFAHSFIYGFHMPLFFILSGYLYSSSRWSDTPFRQYAHAKARAYLLPYIVLAFINLCATFLMEYMQRAASFDLYSSTMNHLRWLLLSNDNYGSSPDCEALWFLPCFFLVTLSFQAIKKQSVKLRSVLIAALCLLQFLFIRNDVQLPWHLNIVPFCTLLFFAGWLLQVKKAMDSPVYTCIIALCIGMAGVIFNPDYLDLNHMRFGNLPLALCGAIGMSYAVIYLCKHYFVKNRLLELYGRNTLIIMGLHMLLSNGILLVLNRIPFFASFGYHWWVNAILVLLLLIPVCRCIEKVHR